MAVGSLRQQGTDSREKENGSTGAATTTVPGNRDRGGCTGGTPGSTRGTGLGGDAGSG
ncbi:conserved hypothetical protein [Paenarthrobacter aurescens TC1]|uniref:Uncharacterized protein n=1 Tax=Paenarthrobacter aurescens (strain TC1) TaxID=290340 RepID=A1R6Q6_PAEAT|nr:conserved hypothetical protein [Paenarthrobacter aurescens TC1]